MLTSTNEAKAMWLSCFNSTKNQHHFPVTMSNPLNVSIPDNKHPGAKRRARLIVAGIALLLGVSLACHWVTRTKTDEQYRIECKTLSDTSQWNKLEQLAREWTGVSAMPDEAYLYLAEAQFESGQTQQALETLVLVPAKSPRSFAALITACNLQFGELNRPMDGVETLKLMIKRKPTSISSRQRLIFFYAITLQRQEMLNAIYDAIEFRAEPPDAYVYLMLADHLSFTNGFARNSEWLESDPDSEVFQVARIVQLIDNIETTENDHAKAVLERYLQTFNELRQKHPQNTVLLVTAVERAAKQFNVSEVDTLIQQVPLEQQDSVILRWKAWVQFQQDAFESCQELLHQSLSQYPLDWHTWHELSACRRRLGDIEGASQAAEIALIGKALRKEMLQLDDASAISTDTLRRLQQYAERCGEHRASLAIGTRLYGLKQAPI
ncbi:MAG: tetratricopeptide repeat protein [Fuerstiella sp.]|jgi:predicted Zn-dependent protease